MKRRSLRKLKEKSKINKTEKDKENPGEQHAGPSRTLRVERRTHQTGEGNGQFTSDDPRHLVAPMSVTAETTSILDLSSVQAQTSHIDDNNRQMYYPQSSTSQREPIAGHQPYGTADVLDPDRPPLTYPDTNWNPAVYNQQMYSQPSTSQRGLVANQHHWGGFVPVYDPIRAQMKTSEIVRNAAVYTQQMPAKPSTSQVERTASNRNSGTGTSMTVSQATTVYHVQHGCAFNQQTSLQLLVKASKTNQVKASKRKQVKASKRKQVKASNILDGLQRLRKILKDYNTAEFQSPVTKDYSDLTEPPDEVYPKLLWLLKFYQGDLLKMMSQYQKDPAFKYGHKTTSPGKELDYKDFLQQIIETEANRISILGQAGSGKTVMMRRLVRDLTKHNEELLIFFKNFRDFPCSKEITLCDFLFYGGIPDSDANLWLDWILENQDKVMFVFDGLDQASWVPDKEAKLIGAHGTGLVSEIVSNIFQGKLFPDVKVVYSSREHAVASLEGELRPEMVVALMGLSPNDSEWLFKSFVGDDGEMLWEKLRMQSHSLIPLLSIPAFLIFTTIVYVNEPKIPPRSMTEVLKNLLKIFMRSGHILQKDVPSVLKGLKKMSFLGMKDGKVLFYIIDVVNAGLDPEKIRDWIIKIPGLNHCNQFLLEGEYVLIFSHQIIQEFFAAQYVIEMDLKSFRQNMKKYLRNDNWSVVTRFVSGLLFNDEIRAHPDKVTDFDVKKNAFKKMLVQRYTSLRVSSPELLATICESNREDLIRDSLQGRKLQIVRMGDYDAYLTATAVRYLDNLNELKFQLCNIKPGAMQILWDSIEHSNLKISKLNFSHNKFESEIFTLIGKVVKKCSVNELILARCDVTNDNVRKLLSTCKEAKISRLAFSNIILDEDAVVFIGDIVERHLLEELTMQECKLGADSLTIELSGATGAKTLKLDFSGNNIHTATSLGNDIRTAFGKFVRMCTVADLSLRSCNLSDEILKNLLSETEGVKILKLDISENRDMEDTGYAMLGKIVKMCTVGELMLRECNLSDGKLKILLSETDGAKISKLDISGNVGIEDTGYATLGKIVKMCRVGELKLIRCNLSDGKLKNLLSETDGAKISKLDVSINHLNEDTAAILGDIVKQCSVEELTVQDCGLNDGLLETPLSRASGAKLSALDVRYNSLSRDILDRITRSITVKHHELNVDEKIKQKVSSFKIKDKAIRPKGRNVDPQESSDLDHPAIASIESSCDTSGISSQGHSTVSHWIDAKSEDNQVEMVSEQDADVKQETDACHTRTGRVVPLQAARFNPFKAVTGWWSKTYLCHYVFFRSSTSELCGLTCIDNETVKNRCISSLTKQGFKMASTLPDQVVLSSGQQAQYKYSCNEPEGSRLEPDVEVLTLKDIANFQLHNFILLPTPAEHSGVVHIKSDLTTPNGTRTSVMALDWKTSEVDVKKETLKVEVKKEFALSESVENIEVEKSSRAFFGLHHNDEAVYPIYPNRAKGMTLIINNDFKGREGEERFGSEFDVYNLWRLWNNLGFNVQTIENLSAYKMQLVCREFAKNFCDVSMVVVIIMSHGEVENGEHFIIGDDMSRVSSNDIISNFTLSKCPHLRGIPKLFIFQKCRGCQHNASLEHTKGEIELWRATDLADMFIAYLTQNEYVYGDRQLGSGIMNAVVNVFKGHACDQHIHDLLTLTNSVVASSGGPSHEVHMVNYLQKRLFLFPGWP